jgi:hypothetical protein
MNSRYTRRGTAALAAIVAGVTSVGALAQPTSTDEARRAAGREQQQVAPAEPEPAATDRAITGLDEARAESAREQGRRAAATDTAPADRPAVATSLDQLRGSEGASQRPRPHDRRQARR